MCLWRFCEVIVVMVVVVVYGGGTLLPGNCNVEASDPLARAMMHRRVNFGIGPSFQKTADDD
jgi:hypothetical protein